MGHTCFCETLRERYLQHKAGVTNLFFSEKVASQTGDSALYVLQLRQVALGPQFGNIFYLSFMWFFPGYGERYQNMVLYNY